MKTKDIFGTQSPTIVGLADKYDVTVLEVMAQLNEGMDIEVEHTNDQSIAMEIAVDHLGEDLYYYQKLKDVES